MDDKTDVIVEQITTAFLGVLFDVLLGIEPQKQKESR